MKKYIGNSIILILAAMNIVLWLMFPPDDDGSSGFTIHMISEIVGSTAVILMACAIFLATKARFLESLFGGLDQMYRVHRISAIGSLVLLYAHVSTIPETESGGIGAALGELALGGTVILMLWALAPRIQRWISHLEQFISGKFSAHHHELHQHTIISSLAALIATIWNWFNSRYHIWRWFHRFIGLFFLAGILHLMLVESLIQTMPVVYVYVLSLAMAAAAAYGYMELLYRARKKTYDYVVEDVLKLTPAVLEVTLKPRQERLPFQAGQFLFVSFDDGNTFREPHPFTICSSPHDEYLRLAVKASGDFTQAMHNQFRSGISAFVEGGYGRFTYKTGHQHQIWIAGGIGITPFLSWIRDRLEASGYEIDLYYTVRESNDALYQDEIQRADMLYSNFRDHVIYSKHDGHLSVEKIVPSGHSVADKDIYLCGPLSMREALRKQFINQGVPARQIHFEEFNFR